MNVIVMVLLAINGPPAESYLPKPPSGKTWIPIATLSDEFNGTGLDPNKWIPKHPSWSGRNSTYTESNVSVRDGDLWLMSTLRPGASEVDAHTVTAACVTSSTPRCHYGYYETRLKCSDISMTSAFWFQGKYSEIDVIENIGNATEPNSLWTNETMMINTHFFKGGWKEDCDTPVRWKMPGSVTEYCVYGLWWKDKEIAWIYHNGVKVSEITLGGPFEE